MGPTPTPNAEVMMQPYASILLVIGVVVAMAIVILILAHAIGPRRSGPIKSSTYESGMPPIADARRRFNVRFYVVALLFLLFDVEVIILWPWAQAFYQAAAKGQSFSAGDAVIDKGFLLVGAGLFLLLLVVGYVYEWKKGVFRWD